jgi:hypothetical protein
MGSITVTQVACNDLSGELQFSTVPPLLALAMPTSGVAPYTYLWNDGRTTQYIQPVVEGSQVSVTITDARNCSTTLSATAPIISTPPPATTGDRVMRFYIKSNTGSDIPKYNSMPVQVFYKIGISGAWQSLGTWQTPTWFHTPINFISNLKVGEIVYLAIVDDETGQDISFGTIRGVPEGRRDFPCCGMRLPEILPVVNDDPAEINIYVDLNSFANEHYTC